MTDYLWWAFISWAGFDFVYYYNISTKYNLRVDNFSEKNERLFGHPLCWECRSTVAWKQFFWVTWTTVSKCNWKLSKMQKMTLSMRFSLFSVSVCSSSSSGKASSKAEVRSDSLMELYLTWHWNWIKLDMHEIMQDLGKQKIKRREEKCKMCTVQIRASFYG